MLRREDIAKCLFNTAMVGHAQWDDLTEPNKDDWRVKADVWILDVATLLEQRASLNGDRAMVAEERADGGAACPRCRINRVGSRPVYLGSKAEGHICAVCWQQDRHAEEQTEAKS